MSRSTFQQLSFIPKLAVLWIALLVLPFAERTLLGAKTYYFLYIGLGLVFVMYGLTIRSIFFFLQHTKREPVYVWIGFLLWSVFILQRSGSLRCRIRSSAPHVRAIDYARPTSS
jgi:hypothetical protein